MKTFAMLSIAKLAACQLRQSIVRATAGDAHSPASTPVLCRDAGEPIVLAADQKWEVDVPTEFQWMPGGVHVITPTYGDRTIRLAVRCHEGTARAVQASFEQWRRAMPKQRPFGCVEHREQEAALLPTGFRWDGEKGGVNCACTPTALGAQNVNGRIHRSWSPSFTTDADYGACKCSDCGKGFGECDSVQCSGVMEFPKGARGSVQNPAEVTGVAFSVGSLTNKPAFRSIDPVRAKDGSGSVTATGTSEGAKKGWESRQAYHRGSGAADMGRVAVKEQDSFSHSLAANDHARAADEHDNAAKASGDEKEVAIHKAHIAFHRALADAHDKLSKALPYPGRNAEEVVKSSTGTVRATWSDAAREAAAAARHAAARSSQSAYNESSKLADDAGLAEHKVAARAHMEAFKAHEKAVDAHKGEPGAQAAAEYHVGMMKQHYLQAQAHGEGQHFPASVMAAFPASVAAAEADIKDATVRAHCKDNLYADVPDATEAEAAAYDECVDGGGSHQQAVAELRKRRNPVDEAVQSSDAILAKLAQSQPPVRARTSDEILGAKPVKATWSDAAREAALAARRAHLYNGMEDKANTAAGKTHAAETASSGAHSELEHMAARTAHHEAERAHMLAAELAADVGHKNIAKKHLAIASYHRTESSNHAAKHASLAQARYDARVDKK